MRTLAKVALILCGYIAAWLIASAAVSAHVALTATDSRGADGMYAFGDGLLFLFVFCGVALIPTVAAIHLVVSRRRSGDAR